MHGAAQVGRGPRAELPVHQGLVGSALRRHGSSPARVAAVVSRDRYRFKMSSYPGINFTRMVTGSSEQPRELGEFVRAHRERLTPAAIGLPAGSRRRTPGLRREEVAQLCGLSATWYSWIEQGRDVSVSPTALARLAAALRLGRAERAYLFELAGKRDP